MLHNKLKDSDTSLHQNISEAIGSLVEHGLKNLSAEDALKNLKIILK